MINTTQNISFDLLVTLSIIKEDKILLKMYNNNIGLDMKIISYQYKNNVLDEKVIDYIKGLFDSLILKDEGFLNKYKNLLKAEIDSQPIIKPSEEVKRLPRRFGKEDTKKKIKEQGGIVTPLDNLLFSLNDLRNGYERTLKKCINDVYRDEKKLTDEKYIKLTKSIKKLIKQIDE